MENDVINISNEKPGRIIQTYLLLVRLLNLDVMAPLQFVKAEPVEVLETVEPTSLSKDNSLKRSYENIESIQASTLPPKEAKLSDQNHEEFVIEEINTETESQMDFFTGKAPVFACKRITSITI